MGVAELGSEEADRYDIVMSSLCLSELSEDELIYALKELRKILKHEGFLLVADETRSKSISKKILNVPIRFFLLTITYILTQTTTHALKNLPEKIKEAGLKVERIRLNKMENFIELLARKPKEPIG